MSELDKLLNGTKRRKRILGTGAGIEKKGPGIGKTYAHFHNGEYPKEIAKKMGTHNPALKNDQLYNEYKQRMEAQREQNRADREVRDGIARVKRNSKTSRPKRVVGRAKDGF